MWYHRRDEAAERTHAARRTPSICRSHAASWFQLVKIWVTTFSEQFSDKPTDGSWDDRIPRTACNSVALRDVYTL
jgi:hypothetical protein